MLFQRRRREMELGMNYSSHAPGEVTRKICYNLSSGDIFSVFSMVDIPPKGVLRAAGARRNHSSLPLCSWTVREQRWSPGQRHSTGMGTQSCSARAADSTLCRESSSDLPPPISFHGERTTTKVAWT